MRSPRVIGIVLSLGLVSAHARAQTVPPDSARRAPVVRPAVDPLAPPISPRRAFLYSLALPGLGQAKLQRSTAAGVYAGFEMISVVMLMKSRHDLNIAKRRMDERVVTAWKIGDDGIPVRTTGGLPVADAVVRNRYAADSADAARSRLKARRLHYEDWVAMLAFTHLFSGADAYVAAHLFDLPGQLESRRLPSGAAGMGWRLPF